MNTRVSCALIVCTGMLAAHSSGQTYGFAPITANTVANGVAGQAQLTVTAAAGPGANQVSFTFNNTGPAAMSIAGVYFDDGTLLGIASIVNGPNVSFSQGASPPDLPGGQDATPPFQTTSGFLAGANPPPPISGVNPGEWLTIRFDLIAGSTFADTIKALNTPGDTLRIGIHVIGFANGGSESFIHVVPAPGAAGALAGLGLLCSRRRR